MRLKWIAQHLSMGAPAIFGQLLENRQAMKICECGPLTACVTKAGKWLQANQDKTSRQARNLRLLMNAWSGRSPAELKEAMAAALAEQNEDGGWSQTPRMPSDAYATGQTLYVLARAGVSADAPEMKRGVEFLRRTQRENGSWPMTSRVNAKNLSPITDTGAAWAVLGLIRASS